MIKKYCDQHSLGGGHMNHLVIPLDPGMISLQTSIYHVPVHKSMASSQEYDINLFRSLNLILKESSNVSRSRL